MLSTLGYETHSDADRDARSVSFFMLRLLFGNEFDLDEIPCGRRAFTSEAMKAKHPGAPSVAVSLAAGDI